MHDREHLVKKIISCIAVLAGLMAIFLPAVFIWSDTKNGQNDGIERIERIEEKRNRNVEGTGLGMAITQRLLSLMDSRLQMQKLQVRADRQVMRIKPRKSRALQMMRSKKRSLMLLFPNTHMESRLPVHP